MSTLFERISNRFFGKPITNQVSIEPKKSRKTVQIREDFNEVKIVQEVENFIEGKRLETRVREKVLKNKLRSIEKKPFVPPVGTILQMLSPKKNFMMAVVVMPDHRLLEVQRGPYSGIHLHPRFIFNTPYEWQCWVKKF